MRHKKGIYNQKTMPPHLFHLTFFLLSYSRTLGALVVGLDGVGTEPPGPRRRAWAGVVAEGPPRPLQTLEGSATHATAMTANKDRLFVPGALGPGAGFPGTTSFPFAFSGGLRGSPPFEMLSPGFRGLGQPDLPKEMASLCESQGL